MSYSSWWLRDSYMRLAVWNENVILSVYFLTPSFHCGSWVLTNSPFLLSWDYCKRTPTLATPNFSILSSSAPFNSPLQHLVPSACRVLFWVAADKNVNTPSIKSSYRHTPTLLYSPWLPLRCCHDPEGFVLLRAGFEQRWSLLVFAFDFCTLLSISCKCFQLLRCQ